MSDLQPLPPGSAAQRWSAPQSPVQHWLPAVQAVPVWLQTVPAQAWLTHDSEQHSPDESQLPPSGLQNAGVVQVAAPDGPEHMPEQHPDADWHEAPAPPQLTAGDAHTPVPLEVSHTPEQQSFAAVQPASSALHTFDGSV